MGRVDIPCNTDHVASNPPFATSDNEPEAQHHPLIFPANRTILCGVKSPALTDKVPDMQLDDALRRIADIHQHMERSTVFRGYRSLTVGFSAVAGLLAAAMQARGVPEPEVELGRYLALWLTIASVSMLVAGAEMFWRATRAQSSAVRQQMLRALEQFVPCVAVGALITLCIYRTAPQVAWLLPGLWSLLFGLGLFASWRLLPREVFWVGLYYVLCGCGCLILGQGENALSPWLMAISFGGGQLIGAGVLYWTLERPHASTTSN